jgi:hypothetical protein
MKRIALCKSGIKNKAKQTSDRRRDAKPQQIPHRNPSPGFRAVETLISQKAKAVNIMAVRPRRRRGADQGCRSGKVAFQE